MSASSVEAARTELAAIAYGPTKLPLYNYLLQLTVLNPTSRPLYISIIRWLAQVACVPVDSADLSGTTTLMWSISTKPYLDLEVAEIMVNAGGEINRRNRYGCVAAAESCMVFDDSPRGRKNACDALKFFLEKGGNVDIADGDRLTPRRIVVNLRTIVCELYDVLQQFESNADSAETPKTEHTETKTQRKKIGRNEPCSCGSSKKFKVCCGKD